MDLLYKVENVSFAYPGEDVCLLNINLDIQAGEKIVMLGANGSGKSTLLHLLDGLYFAQDGAINVMGNLITEESVETPPFGPRFRKEVGFLFQNSDAQLFCATVEEELSFGPLQLKKMTKDEINQRIGDVLNLLEIPHLREKVPQNLSAGQKKMVALASVLMTAPSVLLLDEPTAGLDPRSQSILLEVLEALHEGGITLITATHDLEIISHLAERAIVLGENHKIIGDSSVDTILTDTELLLEANLIHAHYHRHGNIKHKHPHYHVIAHEHVHEDQAI